MVRKSGTFCASASRETASPTSLEITPPAATMPSRSTRYLKAVTPSLALLRSSRSTSTIGRPFTPPAAFTSAIASFMPSRTLMPHGVNGPESELRNAILMGCCAYASRTLVMVSAATLNAAASPMLNLRLMMSSS